MYSDKLFNAYFYEQMLFKIFVAKRNTGRGEYRNLIWVLVDTNFAAGEGFKASIIQSALLDYSVLFLIVVCCILVCK